MKYLIDAQIAATALANGMTLVTRNVDDMAGLGVPIFNPFDSWRIGWAAPPAFSSTSRPQERGKMPHPQKRRQTS